jgi:type VII secretion protein EccB
VPRGPLLGIVGAPDALPPAKRLVGTPWTICVEPADNGGGRQGTVTILHVGRPATGGRDLGDDALLAQAADTGRFFLVWHRRRYAIIDQRVAFTALGLEQKPKTVVDEAWLNALPAGPRLAPTVPTGAGTPSTAVGGARIGQVYVVEGAGTGRQFFVVADTRQLASITEVEANFLLADPEIGAAYPGEQARARTLSLTEATTADKQPPADRPTDAPPATVPRIVVPTSAGAGVCAEFNTASGAPRLVADVPPNDSASASVTTGRTADGVALVTRVDLRPGAAVVVEAMPAPGAPTGTLFLVTDLGLRHAFASPEARAALGYGAVRPVRMPADLVARIPTGPTLDAVLAGSPVQPR